jgi:hypothetical protein
MRQALVSICLVAAWMMPVGAQTTDRLKKELETIAALVSDGYGRYEGPESVVRGAAQTPFADRTVVLFSLKEAGGGNGWARQFLAVLQRNAPDMRFPNGRAPRAYSLVALVQTGDDFDRFFKQIELRRDRIVLKGAGWAKDDAHCCPSLEATATYRLSAHGLNEVQR